MGKVERATRFELATACLGSKNSTTELHPLVGFDVTTSPWRAIRAANVVVPERGASAPHDNACNRFNRSGSFVASHGSAESAAYDLPK